jgi:hypothetical protein
MPAMDTDRGSLPMFDRLIRASIRGRLLVLLVFVSVVAYGVHSYRQMPVDAFPDISPIMVPIFAEAHGMAPEEIERLIAYPIEASMNGLPDVTQIKSTSAFGMAVVYVYFQDDVDIYFARQLVAERLAAAMNDLPEMHDPPTLGPISTGLGQVLLYYLTLDPGADTQGKPPDAYLREVNDWVVSFQLQTVPGVTDVLSMGGHVLQFQIRVASIRTRCSSTVSISNPSSRRCGRTTETSAGSSLSWGSRSTSCGGWGSWGRWTRSRRSRSRHWMAFRSRSVTSPTSCTARRSAAAWSCATARARSSPASS